MSTNLTKGVSRRIVRLRHLYHEFATCETNVSFVSLTISFIKILIKLLAVLGRGQTLRICKAVCYASAFFSLDNVFGIVRCSGWMWIGCRCHRHGLGNGLAQRDRLQRLVLVRAEKTKKSPEQGRETVRYGEGPFHQTLVV